MKPPIAIAQIDDQPLADAIRTRYLNYSLSVIQSRALPDVRDGLKPSQRRILVAMNDLNLGPTAKFLKCAKICGDTSGNYHPHGESIVYPTLVRMAQPFSLRYPLVQGQGNFGSLDGDNAAAMRYTEARMSAMAMELLRELQQDTVDWRPNYDGRMQEPRVLPARYPQLLVNGSTGIAVGMATSIPPHNLVEVTNALLALIDDPEITPARLMKSVKGPDFPTGGIVINGRDELREIYETGQGSIRIRGEWKVETGARNKAFLVITSIPYGINKAQLVEAIGAHVGTKKVPQIVDVKDESTEVVRIVCELKSEDDAPIAAAYLYKHTDLQSNFPVNLNCLIPTNQPGLLRPERLGLKEMLQQFLAFREEVVRRRLEFDLRKLERKIHILKGFEILFDALDEAIRIIRSSDGKQDCKQKLMKRFGLDDDQTEAIVMLHLYKLAKLEILEIRRELEELEKEARKIRGILKSREKFQDKIKEELKEVADAHGDKRRTAIGSGEEEVEFNPEAYIVREDAYVILTKDGRLKRQGSIKTLDTVRVREGDAVAIVAAGSTTENVALLSNFGSVYVLRIADVPATSGHGDPIQAMFKFADGERAIAAFSFDPRFRPPMPVDPGPEDPPGPHLLVVTRQGYGFRFSLSAHSEPTTRSGRRYARVAEGDEILGVVGVTGEEAVVTASTEGRVLLCPVHEVGILSGAGRGVIVHKLADDDALVGFQTVLYEDDAVVVEKTTGGEAKISAKEYRVSGRAGKGFELTKRGGIARMVPRPIVVPSFEQTQGNE